MITELQQTYTFPIIYARSERNLGYDRNYRRSLELATGTYCIVLGNDDTIVGEQAIANLVAFLTKEHYPDVGFVNYFEFASPGLIVKRAAKSGVIGSGKEIAIQYYNCFSFVGGLIYKKSVFEKYNTDQYDGSIYAQMYIGATILLHGGRLFSIAEPLVGKDIQLEQKIAHSYRDKISRKWSKFRKVDGGLPSVMHVIFSAIRDAGVADREDYYIIFKKIYSRTFPYWILDYKYNKALPEAVGLVWGMLPSNNLNFSHLKKWDKVRVYLYYIILGTSALIFPSQLFFKWKHTLYAYLKT
jgi:glycosyltransferase involved in cell wall biosynthesis